MRISSLEQAVASLVEANQKIDVSSAFATYLVLAGFSDLCDDAVIAFEHALEKHPETHILYTKAIRELTNEYYSDKFGVSGTCGNGACKHCAAYALAAEAELQLDAPYPIVEKPRLRKKKKRNGKSTICKTKKSTTSGVDTPDPYQASTSALV